MSSWLHFLNLQYWYCLIYSAFGGKCAYLEELRKQQAATHPSVAVTKASFLDTLMHGVQSSWSIFTHGAGSVWDVVGGILAWLWHAYSALAYSVSGFLAFSILSAILGLAFIRFRELSTFGTLPPRVREGSAEQSRWQALLEEVKSTDPKRWRNAILEGDSMLGEVLAKLGYQGVNTDERMRNLPEDAFVTVPIAWEAHRIRNFVSSGGSDFVLTQREAFRTMKLYEQVFEEFEFI